MQFLLDKKAAEGILWLKNYLLFIIFIFKRFSRVIYSFSFWCYYNSSWKFNNPILEISLENYLKF